MAEDGDTRVLVVVAAREVHRARGVGRGPARVVSRAASVAIEPSLRRPLMVACHEGCTLVGLGETGYVATRLDPPRRTVELPFEAPPTGLRRAVDGATLWLLVADPGARLLEVPLAGAGEPTARVLDDARDGRLREPLGLVAHAEGVVGLYRRGVPEDAASEVVLVTPTGQHGLEPLHDLAKLERLEVTPAGVELVSAFEFGRPIHFTFGLDGALRSHAELPVSAPGDEVSRVELEADADAVVAVARSRAGDELTRARFDRAAGTLPPSVTRTSHGFSVVFTDRIADAWWVRVADLEGARSTP